MLNGMKSRIENRKAGQNKGDTVENTSPFVALGAPELFPNKAHFIEKKILLLPIKKVQVKLRELFKAHD